jgi:hypothetical protein
MTLGSRNPRARRGGRVALVALALAGCSSDSGGRQTDTTGLTSLGSGGDETNGDGDGDPTTTGPLLDAPAGDGDGDPNPNECAAVSETAQNQLLPVDIIFAIDTSGSMSDEKNFVQQNMNMFSQQIFLANIDSHVVMIAEASPDGPCVNVPLGSGSCPEDTKLPEYLHVFEGVSSSNALSQILATQPQWSSSIRPGSIKHLVVVSDDDSSMGAGEFDSMFKAIDPDYADYIFHGIVAYEAPDPLECQFLGASCCAGFIPLAADVGDVYLELAQLTGGITGDLCEQEFGPVFNQIAQSVVGTTPLACEWDIPDAPEGETFDPGKVNVALTLDGLDEDVFFVADAADCGVGDGWYYFPDSEDPETIRVCPATCDRIQAAGQASVDILFGCATVPVG